MSLRVSSFAGVVTVTLLASCGEPAPSPSLATGGSSAGGAGGTSTGGSIGTGGLSSGGQIGTGGLGTGGLTGTGGLMGTGGLTGTGGLAGSAGVSSGGPSGAASGGNSAIPPTFETVKLVIANVPCFGAGCHNDEQNPLDMKIDDQLYTRLTSRISVQCGNLPVVNPSKPQESALLKILKGPCGTTPRMPVTCVTDGDSSCVPDDYIAAITQWIANGAPRQ